MLSKLTLLLVVTTCGVAAQPSGGPISPWYILPHYTVSELPTAGVPYRVAFVTDGATTSTCTSGGGSNKVFCYDTGSTWALGSSSGSALTKSGPYFYDGSNYYFGSTLMPAYRPSLLSLAWVNQGTSSVAGASYETLTVVQGSSGFHMRTATLSVNTVEGWFLDSFPIAGGTTTEGCNLILRESATGKTLNTFHYNNSNLSRIFSGYYTGDGTGFGGQVEAAVPIWQGSLFGFRYSLSGGTWTISYSSGTIDASGDPIWAKIGSIAATTAFTTAANQFGYGAGSPLLSSTSGYCTVLSLRSF